MLGNFAQELRGLLNHGMDTPFIGGVVEGGHAGSFKDYLAITGTRERVDVNSEKCLLYTFLIMCDGDPKDDFVAVDDIKTNHIELVSPVGAQSICDSSADVRLSINELTALAFQPIFLHHFVASVVASMQPRECPNDGRSTDDHCEYRPAVEKRIHLTSPLCLASFQTIGESRYPNLPLV